MDTYYAIKQDQSHVYDTTGKRLFVTKLNANPLKVTQVKSQDKDGYAALQVGVGEAKRVNKPLAGHLKNAGVITRKLREIKVNDAAVKQVGEQITVSEVLKVGDLVTIRSVSKGKGFQGGMKRWGFHGGPKTHGQSDRGRAPGSIGQGTTPGRIWKGKRMAGHMGSTQIAVKGGQVVAIDETTNELYITGTVPGARGSLVEVTKVGEKKFVGLMEEEKSVKQEETVAEEATQESVTE